MKKAISLVLMLCLIIGTFSVVSFSASEVLPDENKAYIKVDDRYYEVLKGDTFTYVFNLGCSVKISSIDVHTVYSAGGLEFVPETDEFGDYDLLAMYPVLKTVVYNFKDSGKINFNYSSIKGARFPLAENSAYTQDNYLLVYKFKVTASSGTYEINTRIKTLGDMSANKIIYNYEHVDNDIVVTTGSEIQDIKNSDDIVAPSEETMNPTQPATDPSETPTESETLETVVPTEMPPVFEPIDVLYGDVNGDSKINIFDASHIQKHIAGYDGYELDDCAKMAADVDFNGKINIFDASRIQKFIAGYFESFE